MKKGVTKNIISLAVSCVLLVVMSLLFKNSQLFASVGETGLLEL